MPVVDWDRNSAAGSSLNPPFHVWGFQPLLQYVIFPFQFAYLYSYYPSGSIREIAADLEAKWKITHEQEAEKAFALVEEEGQRVAGPSFFQKAETPLTVMAAKKRDD